MATASLLADNTSIRLPGAPVIPLRENAPWAVSLFAGMYDGSHFLGFPCR